MCVPEETRRYSLTAYFIFQRQCCFLKGGRSGAKMQMTEMRLYLILKLKVNQGNLISQKCMQILWRLILQE